MVNLLRRQSAAIRFAREVLSLNYLQSLIILGLALISAALNGAAGVMVSRLVISDTGVGSSAVLGAAVIASVFLAVLSLWQSERLQVNAWQRFEQTQISGLVTAAQAWLERRPIRTFSDQDLDVPEVGKMLLAARASIVRSGFGVRATFRATTASISGAVFLLLLFWTQPMLSALTIGFLACFLLPVLLKQWPSVTRAEREKSAARKSELESFRVAVETMLNSESHDAPTTFFSQNKAAISLQSVFFFTLSRLRFLVVIITIFSVALGISGHYLIMGEPPATASLISTLTLGGLLVVSLSSLVLQATMLSRFYPNFTFVHSVLDFLNPSSVHGEHGTLLNAPTSELIIDDSEAE